MPSDLLKLGSRGRWSCGREWTEMPSHQPSTHTGVHWWHASGPSGRSPGCPASGTGRSRARYTGPDQALHNGPRTFETRVDAEAWLADERRLISAGAWSSPHRPAGGRATRHRWGTTSCPGSAALPLMRSRPTACAPGTPRMATAPDRPCPRLCGPDWLRFGEAVALLLRDVDLERGIIRVTRTAVRADGSRVSGPPESEAHRRTVAMPRAVVDALRVHLAEYPVTTRDALLFPGRDGCLPAHSSLYGLPAREERRDGRVYRKEPFGSCGPGSSSANPDCAGTTFVAVEQPGSPSGSHGSRDAVATGPQHTPDGAVLPECTAERDRTIADRLQAQIDRGRRTQRC